MENYGRTVRGNGRRGAAGEKRGSAGGTLAQAERETLTLGASSEDGGFAGPACCRAKGRSSGRAHTNENQRGQPAGQNGAEGEREKGARSLMTQSFLPRTEECSLVINLPSRIYQMTLLCDSRNHRLIVLCGWK